MTTPGQTPEIPPDAHHPWDLIVVGGGISGAALFQAAAARGLRTLLLEQRDFAWGTSSRSSKLVHGGLRYLKQGNIKLTLHSVREREALLENLPGLVNPLPFLFCIYTGRLPHKSVLKAGLSIYDCLAQRRIHRFHSPQDLQFIAPYLNAQHLMGGFTYTDAVTDDSRLTYRVLQDGIRHGGKAYNYTRVTQLITDGDSIAGVRVFDERTGTDREYAARVVVNAAGAAADTLRSWVQAPPVIRPLRGSHLVFPAWRLPVSVAVTLLHPRDLRPVYIFPWEGVTVVGTTDVDHQASPHDEPRMSREERDYLMEAVDFQFPHLNVETSDIVSTWAGVRPVISHGKKDPSKESRDHLITEDHGLITLTGGKLTTFRLMAQQALRKVVRVLHRRCDIPPPRSQSPFATARDHHSEVQQLPCWNRIHGRLGPDATRLFEAAAPGELDTIPGTRTVWAELRWAATNEDVFHLDDLLLRRTRLGHQLSQGGAAHESRIRHLTKQALGWNDAQWHDEWERYIQLWRTHYGPDPS